MPKKRKKQARAAAQRAKPKKSAKAAPVAEPLPVGAPPGTDMAAASQRFTSDLLVRGEAAKLDKKGKLPLHATHVLKKRRADGSAEVERVRFKTF